MNRITRIFALGIAAAVGLSLAGLSPATAAPTDPSEFTFSGAFYTNPGEPSVEVEMSGGANATINAELLNNKVDGNDAVVGSVAPQPYIDAYNYRGLIPLNGFKLGPVIKVRATLETAEGSSIFIQEFPNPNWETQGNENDPKTPDPVSIGTMGYFSLGGGVRNFTVRIPTFPGAEATVVATVLGSCDDNSSTAYAEGTATYSGNGVHLIEFSGLDSSVIGPDLRVRLLATAEGYTQATSLQVLPGSMGGTCPRVEPPVVNKPKVIPSTWVKSWGKKSGKAKVKRTAKITKVARTSAGVTNGVAFRYQWYLSGKPVRGATRSTFKAPKTATVMAGTRASRVKAKGRSLTVKVTAVKHGYVSKTKTHSFGKVKK